MSLPVGMSLATVTFGKRSGVRGTEAVLTGTISSDRTLIWDATGEGIDAVPDPIPASLAGGFLTFQVPHTNQTGIRDQSGNAVINWALIFEGEIKYPGRSAIKVRKAFQVPTGVTNLDLDLVPDGPITPAVTAPTPPVVSVAGRTGAVSVEDLKTDLAVPTPSQIDTRADARLSTQGPILFPTVEHGGVRRSASTVMLGDSNFAINTDVPGRTYGESLPNLIAAKSGGRMLMAENAGIPSETVQQIAARVPTDVVARKPGRCMVLAGSNSTTKGLAHFAEAQTVYETGIILPLLRAGIEPILCTIPPRQDSRTAPDPSYGSSAPYIYRLTLAWNVHVRAMAQKYRLPLVDFYAIVTDPATGNWKPAYLGDGVHWGDRPAHHAIAQAAWDQISSSFPATVAVPFEYDDYSIVNAFQDPLFLRAFSSGSGGRFPLGWNGPSAAPPAVAATDPVAGDGLTAGKWLQITKASGGSLNINSIRTLAAWATASGLTISAGDRIGWFGRYQIVTPADGFYVSMQARYRDGGGANLKTVTPVSQYQTPSTGFFYVEDTIPAGCADVRFDVSLGTSGTGVVRLGQVGALDLTAMGLPSLLASL